MSSIDIEGRDIEMGDIVLRSMQGLLTKHYVLGYTKGIRKFPILSCFRTKDTWHKSPHIDYRGYSNLDLHNAKQTPPYRWGDLYILEKNAEIPEKLKKLIRK